MEVHTRPLALAVPFETLRETLRANGVWSKGNPVRSSERPRQLQIQGAFVMAQDMPFGDIHKRRPTIALRVLIADDDGEIRSLVSFVIQQDPAIVLVGEATNGEEAILLAGRSQPDLVLMDIMMPGVGGLEATRRIKRDWPNTKILVLTSLYGAEARRSAFMNGADSFLDKRDIATKLLAAINDTSHLGGRPWGVGPSQTGGAAGIPQA